MFDRLPISNWVDGRVALTGDAAHPMLQYLAQGACQAIEDAGVFSTYADPAGAWPGSWDGALASYAADRVSRAGRVQTLARGWGELWHCDGLARSLRNELLRDRDPHDFRRIDWFYGDPAATPAP